MMYNIFLSQGQHSDQGHRNIRVE